MRAVVLVAVLAACGDSTRGITVVAGPPWSEALGELVALTPYDHIALATVDAPEAEASAPDTGDDRIVIVDDPALAAEAYRVESPSPRTLVVHAHDVLGAQYGASEALEDLGFRFRHPADALVPKDPVLDPNAALGTPHAPMVRVRGLQLHTLHPIDSYFAFWEPSAENTHDAHRIIDWLIRNRGNYLQWVALDDILDAATHADWQAFTRELIDYAHMRGIRVGLNIQLFGQSNLQLAFDLSDDKTGTIPIHDEIAARLPLVTADLPFDVFSLSFGEFFNADPDKFIAAVNEVAAQLRGLAPAAEMHAVVHVGAHQRITYMGQDIIYYFLVQFADPTIVPDIHTVMFYDLFEDAGGAYFHTDFSEHRKYLEDRMCAHKPAAYFPETAYWVAFDNSVPQLDPVYVTSRWLDLDRLAAAGCGTLDEHLVFSSGWEWGYWLNDTATLRASYERPADPTQLIADQLAPDLGAATDLVAELAQAQHDALIDRHLAAYVAGRDVAIEAGRSIGVVSQPDRITFDDLVASGDITGFTASVRDPLAAYADQLDDLAARFTAAKLPKSRWSRELTDGFAIDRIRAHFMVACYDATIAHIAGDDAAATAALAAANAAFADGLEVVHARAKDLHDDHARRLVDRTANHTFYPYGYLFNADTLCFWQRELSAVSAILGDTSVPAPSCLL